MSTNPFVKKTWQNRLSEFPTRRRLTDVATGDEQVVDFTREEGQIYTEGDGFTQLNMNDLEQRIFDAFGAGAVDNELIPRAIPKDWTEEYQNGVLGEYYADIRVGDVFQLSRIIRSPYDIAHPFKTTDGDEHICGTDWVVVLDKEPGGLGGTRLTLAPATVDRVMRPSGQLEIVNPASLGFFGRISYPTQPQSLIFPGSDTALWAEIGTEYEAPTQTELDEGTATILKQLYYEFGTTQSTSLHNVSMDRISNQNIPYGNSVDANGDVSGYISASGDKRRVCFLSDIDLFGYTLLPNEVMLGNQFKFRNKQYTLFNLSALLTSGNYGGVRMLHKSSGGTNWIADDKIAGPATLLSTIGKGTNAAVVTRPNIPYNYQFGTLGRLALYCDVISGYSHTEILSDVRSSAGICLKFRVIVHEP